MSQVGEIHSVAASVRVEAVLGEAATARLALFSQVLFASCVCEAGEEEEAGGQQRSMLLLLALATIATGPPPASTLWGPVSLRFAFACRFGRGSAAAAR